MLYLEKKYYDEVKQSESFKDYYDREDFYEANPGLIIPMFNFQRLKYGELPANIHLETIEEVNAIFEPYLSSGIIHDTTAPKGLAEMLSFFLKPKNEFDALPHGHQFFLHEDFKIVPYELEPDEDSYFLHKFIHKSEGLQEKGVNYVLIEGQVFSLPNIKLNVKKEWIKINVVSTFEYLNITECNFVVYLKASDWKKAQGKDFHTVFIELVQPPGLDYGYYY